MKSIVSIAALAGVALSKSNFEMTSFNVDTALEDKGVTVTSTPNIGANTYNPCYLACGTLRKEYGSDSVLWPTDNAYKSFLETYWSAQQRNIEPGCVFKPQTAQDVSVAVLLSRRSGCPFAVKSGGHSAVPGGSNIQRGVTISFERMNQTVVSADKKTVSFQPGQTWTEVYTKLAKDNLVIIGGRAGSVGVGGLTLGGGISYFSNLYGLACDNVISYEVVTACGKVINVSATSYPDLFWALRGGGNNFGIVTKFTVAAIQKSPLMWGGTRLYAQPAFSALLKAFYNLGHNVAKDGKAHQILSFGYGGPQIGYAANVELEYADPNGNAAVLAEYNAIGSQGMLQGQTGNATLLQLTSALAQSSGGNGARQSFITWSVGLDLNLANITMNILFEEIPSVINATGILPALSFQVISEPMIQQTFKNGGNPLGLDPKEGPLMLVLLNTKWTDIRDDERIHAFEMRVKRRSEAAALAAGKATDYIYMNYGNPSQDVISGYGATNKAKLLAIAKKYDPSGVFQKLQPGYFKLEGAPNDNIKQIN